MTLPNTVEVCVDLPEFSDPLPMGSLRRQPSGRSGDIFSFDYHEAWLRRTEAFAFDPDLALVSGAQYPAAKRASFGIFLDSSPDRWGRVLMQRRENLRARADQRAPSALGEWDFLLGVHDETRLGALRFRTGPDAPYIDNDSIRAAPPLTSLAALQSASLNFETHIEEEDHPEYLQWLALLFAPGTSLGGARPKASIRDESNALCIAKFPSRNDTRDVGAWEIVAHRLAARAGIDVPDVRAIKLGDSTYTTFLARRFDRTDGGRRRAFVSAMTLTQRTDGEPGASYLELVDLLQSRGAHTTRDCDELFRRVLFNILIHNTDDHLRNHGFFIGPEGIELSPAYDMNPSIERTHLSLAINEHDTACDVSIAMDARQDYGLSAPRAARILEEVSSGIADWKSEATLLAIPKPEQDLMRAAFFATAIA